MKFTDMYIKKMVAPEKKTYIREGEGFTLRIMPSGAKSFVFIYTFDGNRKEMSLGLYPDVSLADARIKHGDAKKLLAAGKDPGELQREAKQERLKAHTVAELCADYIKRHAKKEKRSWAKDEAILDKDVIPAWGKRKAEDIKKRDVVLLLEKIVDRGAPIMAKNTYAVIRKMFNWSVEKDILKISPCVGIKAQKSRDPRDRVLSEDEIKTLWANLDRTDLNMSDEIKRALKLVLATGQRPGEVIGLHSSEIDGTWWTLPAERSKNGREHRVYLTDTALDLIGSLTITDPKTKETKPKGFIFKTPINAKDQPIGETALPIAVKRNLPLLGIEQFTPHDLRRTAATFMSKAGFMDEVIDSVLNHKKQGIIATYNMNKYDREKQQALEAWERKLNSIIKPSKVDNVIPFNKVA